MLIHSSQELAAFIKHQRKKCQLSQKDVGDLVGLKQKTISNIENNPDNVKLSTLFRVLSAINAELRADPKQLLEHTKAAWGEEW
jgi:HTH-type transcriptional regulator / antitoxin HipB